MWTIYEQIVEIQFFLCKVVKMKNYDVENINSFVALYFFLCKVVKMRKDLEEINIQQESTVLSLKKKHQVAWVWLELKLNNNQIFPLLFKWTNVFQDAILEMSEQIDQLGKLKARWVLFFNMCRVEVSFGFWSDSNWDKDAKAKIDAITQKQ